MKRPNHQGEILNRFESKPKGVIFITSDFLDLAEANTLRKTLKRLVDSRKITRILDGMYVMLEYSIILKKFVYPSPLSVAKALARKFKWEIYPSGDTALNIVGLSTQISNSYEFSSDGPYKTYEYLNYQVKFKRTANKKIKLTSDELICLVIAIAALGKNNISEQQIQIIKTYYIKNINVKVSPEEIKTLPEWIYAILKNIDLEI